MRIQVKKLIAVIGVVLLMGCTVTDGDRRISDDKLLTKITRGETTMLEVKSLLGEPAVIARDTDGDDYWVYKYTQTKLKAGTFVPILNNIMAGGRGKTHTLGISFKGNKVFDFKKQYKEEDVK
jgi:outer membrane protein assembly factor BamE (lipoprotein component of BamABCDE complex)